MGHLCCAACGGSAFVLRAVEVHWYTCVLACETTIDTAFCLSLSSGGSVFGLTETSGTTMGTDIRVTGILDYELSSSITLTIRVSSPPII